MATKLTKRVVEALEPRQREYIVWDTQIAGFGVRIMPSGRRTYLFRYRDKHGTDRKPKIGVHSQQMTCDQAREIAQDWSYKAAKGEDPTAGRRVKNSPTIDDLYREYMARHAPNKKERSRKEDERLWKQCVLPRLGIKKKVVEITSDDIEDLKEKMKGTPTQANRVLSLLSKAFALCEKRSWKWRPKNSNPVKGVDKFKEVERQRYLSRPELQKIVEGLEPFWKSDAITDRSFAGLVMLLILTGARISEIITAKREWIVKDFLYLDDSKSGARKIHLNDLALEIINQLPSVDGNPYLIVGRRRARHLVNAGKLWKRLLTSVGVSDLRRHDLRHSFASMGLSGGLSLLAIGKLLGHSSPLSTKRYAHLEQTTHRDVGNAVHKEISNWISGEDQSKK